MTSASEIATQPIHVVGIGASAGGLEALERFFANVPVDPGMAFVVVQHLSPDFKSLMDELLARHTKLPIHPVEDGMRIEANHVYLIPPKKEMIVSSGCLLLSERDRQQELTMPIDVFFRSLAQDCGSRAIAIVLSGGGSDGSRGIKDVHDMGGLVIVQDEASAQFDGMPRTARDAGVAHWVLAPEEMPAVLVEHVRNAGGRMAPKIAAPQGLGIVYQMLQTEFEIDFKDYKPSTVTRRIERRISLSRAADVDDYIARLRDDRSELDVLYRDLLIGVTRFFRNEEAFEVLRERVLPELMERVPKDAPLRIWVAGCATGEEPYSIAILLQELMAVHGERPVKIFATDVHRGSLDVAARGLYDEEAVEGVSDERLAQWFLRQGRCYQVIPDLRKMVVFAQHNVVKDPPFTRVDLVSCRNLLIYLQPAAQQKVLSLFHFALNRGGIAVLGPSESPGPLAHDFETIDGRWRIYRKHSDVRMPVEPRLQPTKSGEPRVALASQGFLRQSPSQILEAYDSLLDDLVPPSLLVNDRGELLHAFAGASRFFKRKDGRQSLDLLEMVDAELKMVLVGGLKRAATERTKIVYTGVRIDVDGEIGSYRVTIRAARNRGGAPTSLLVSFESVDVPQVAGAEETSTEIDIGSVPHEQVAALESELNYTRESLQSAIEELETSNEELQAANEELLASNEELQSTNEELQSVNEELYTVNAEYQRKIDELTELNNDMDNLLSSTDVGTIFLDAKLQVRKMTPQIGETFNLLPTDIGRPIESFTHTIDHPELMADLRRVLEREDPIEREIRDREGRAFFMRVLPYRAKGTVVGVVLTLIDVSGLKAAEDALFHERYLLNSLLSSVRDSIYFRDVHGRYIRANSPMASRLGIADPQKLVGKTPFEICKPALAMTIHEKDDAVLSTGTPQHYLVEQHASDQGRIAWDLATRLPLQDRDGDVVGVIGVLRDITKEKLAEEEIKKSVERRDQFLAMLSHELRNPLGAIVMALTVLRDNGSPEHRASLLKTLERQSSQMARLLDDLLEASRVTQDKIELRRQIVDLGAVARDAADAVRAAMDGRGVEFAIDVDAQPLWVDGDPARLQQIQVNMLSNAAKYTPPRGHVRLEVRRDGDEAVVSVRDDGAGIANEMLDKVFDLFVQSDRTLDRSDGGLGLGLTLVRSLVTMHGGSVCAKSDGEGTGAEFVVRLPLAPAPSDEASLPARRRPFRRGARVVVIEDNDDSRDLLCHLLRVSGFDARGAYDGPEGLALIQDVHPDVAFVDLGLPGIDGFEVARRVRRDPQLDGIWLIALTGYGQTADRERAFEAGFDEHVVKPLAPEKLTQMLADGDPSPRLAHD
jgi:two-component system, chemotaxis family, CheB/CheR fusion protein